MRNSTELFDDRYLPLNDNDRCLIIIILGHCANRAAEGEFEQPDIDSIGVLPYIDLLSQFGFGTVCRPEASDSLLGKWRIGSTLPFALSHHPRRIFGRTQVFEWPVEQFFQLYMKVQNKRCCFPFSLPWA